MAYDNDEGARMSIEKAESLRAEWKKNGSQNCEHEQKKVERYDEAGRSTTGDWYCTKCGKLF